VAAVKAKVVGLVAEGGSGKDTVFGIFKKLLPDKTVVRIAFGDAVKEEVAERHELRLEDLEDNKESFRNILQEWGTEYRRKQDEFYWIKKLSPQIDILKENADVLVFTDVRFLNEADFIREKLKGNIIKITAKGDRVLKSDHISETELQYIKPDWLLPNTGTVKELAEGVAFLIHDLEIEDFNDE
jgi:phosphomevalonate kinase